MDRPVWTRRACNRIPGATRRLFAMLHMLKAWERDYTRPTSSELSATNWVMPASAGSCLPVTSCIDVCV